MAPGSLHPHDDLIRGIAAPASLTLIVAASGAGLDTLAIQAAVALSSGAPFIGSKIARPLDTLVMVDLQRVESFLRHVEAHERGEASTRAGPLLTQETDTDFGGLIGRPLENAQLWIDKAVENGAPTVCIVADLTTLHTLRSAAPAHELAAILRMLRHDAPDTAFIVFAGTTFAGGSRFACDAIADEADRVFGLTVDNLLVRFSSKLDVGKLAIQLDLGDAPYLDCNHTFPVLSVRPAPEPKEVPRIPFGQSILQATLDAQGREPLEICDDKHAAMIDEWYTVKFYGEQCPSNDMRLITWGAMQGPKDGPAMQLLHVARDRHKAATA